MTNVDEPSKWKKALPSLKYIGNIAANAVITLIIIYLSDLELLITASIPGRVPLARKSNIAPPPEEI